MSRFALVRRMLRATALSCALIGALPATQAQSAVAEASALSALPIAVSVTAPVAIVSAGAMLAVVSYQSAVTDIGVA